MKYKINFTIFFYNFYKMLYNWRAEQWRARIAAPAGTRVATPTPAGHKNFNENWKRCAPHAVGKSDYRCRLPCGR